MSFLFDDPMQPREALQGGRCNMHATSCRVDYDAFERIGHMDIQSLYPFVMLSDYPIGRCRRARALHHHRRPIAGEPRIVFGKHANSKAFRDRNFKFFVARCVLLPPRDLRVPGVGFHTFNKS